MITGQAYPDVFNLASAQVQARAGGTVTAGDRDWLCWRALPEPIIYGLIMRFRRTIPIVVIAGAIGGALNGAFKAGN